MTAHEIARIEDLRHSVRWIPPDWWKPKQLRALLRCCDHTYPGGRSAMTEEMVSLAIWRERCQICRRVGPFQGHWPGPQ